MAATVTNRPAPLTPPAARGKLLTGNLRQARANPLKLYMEAREKFGDIVRFRSLPTIYWYALSHPDDVEYVLRENQQNYIRDSYTRNAFGALIGEGLFTSDGDFWRRQRRLAQPAFHRQRLAALGNTMTDAATDMGQHWSASAKAAKPVDVAGEMTRLTLRIACLTLFSTDINNEANEVARAVRESLEHVNYRLTHLPIFGDRFPTPRNRRFLRARKTLDDVTYSIINERRRNRADTGDLLSMLMLARDEETGEGMSDRQLRDEVLTLLIAGHETVSTSLSWTWYLLSQHTEVERRFHEELATVLDGRTPITEDLSKLSYTRMVIDESMRLYPPVWGMARQAQKEDVIRGYKIPAKALISFCQYVIHRHPDFWDDPESFDPERFSPERSHGRPRFAYFPFGGGPRVCIGNNFAMMEMQLTLAALGQRYRLRLVPGQQIIPETLLTLKTRNGIVMNVDERRQ
jgi:cytochrome P450